MRSFQIDSSDLSVCYTTFRILVCWTIVLVDCSVNQTSFNQTHQIYSCLGETFKQTPMYIGLHCKQINQFRPYMLDALSNKLVRSLHILQVRLVPISEDLLKGRVRLVRMSEDLKLTCQACPYVRHNFKKTRLACPLTEVLSKRFVPIRQPFKYAHQDCLYVG